MIDRPVTLPDGRHGFWHIELDADSPRRSIETWVVVRAELVRQMRLGL